MRYAGLRKSCAYVKEIMVGRGKGRWGGRERGLKKRRRQWPIYLGKTKTTTRGLDLLTTQM